MVYIFNMQNQDCHASRGRHLNADVGLWNIHDFQKMYCLCKNPSNEFSSAWTPTLSTQTPSSSTKMQWNLHGFSRDHADT